MTRPLIIGQAPARGNDDKPPFSGNSGARLARLAGVGSTGDVLPNHFLLENLVSKYPGKVGTGKGDIFDLDAAKLQASILMEHMQFMNPRWVLLMGRGVARAFGENRRQYLRPWNWNQHRMVVFPHPSAVNRWYNVQTNVVMAQHFLRMVLDESNKV